MLEQIIILVLLSCENEYCYLTDNSTFFDFMKINYKKTQKFQTTIKAYKAFL